ncbi:hypothetical protein NSK_003420 [Nannochloropsis salina CCMP1776]|uniref:Uncharacterized protein n=1 Tax=Nannochloropsis salina CCMP1776 TaxID=1027361 RepID=A0A4D9D6B3_9STRA|nr:hypothetical protein NSK_003420 [Nannochloropsis salina CCMP1776]|eukprot:TFJ84995.1 hypothetical protein NSK_003420 [Nannochloropsis salina CCMP1776]
MWNQRPSSLAGLRDRNSGHALCIAHGAKSTGNQKGYERAQPLPPERLPPHQRLHRAVGGGGEGGKRKPKGKKKGEGEEKEDLMKEWGGNFVGRKKLFSAPTKGGGEEGQGLKAAGGGGGGGGEKGGPVPRLSGDQLKKLSKTGRQGEEEESIEELSEVEMRALGLEMDGGEEEEDASDEPDDGNDIVVEDFGTEKDEEEGAGGRGEGRGGRTGFTRSTAASARCSHRERTGGGG